MHIFKLPQLYFDDIRSLPVQRTIYLIRAFPVARVGGYCTCGDNEALFQYRDRRGCQNVENSGPARRRGDSYIGWGSQGSYQSGRGEYEIQEVLDLMLEGTPLVARKRRQDLA